MAQNPNDPNQQRAKGTNSADISKGRDAVDMPADMRLPSYPSLPPPVHSNYKGSDPCNYQFSRKADQNPGRNASNVSADMCPTGYPRFPPVSQAAPIHAGPSNHPPEAGPSTSSGGTVAGQVIGTEPFSSGVAADGYPKAVEGYAKDHATVVELDKYVEKRKETPTSTRAHKLRRWSEEQDICLIILSRNNAKTEDEMKRIPWIPNAPGDTKSRSRVSINSRRLTLKGKYNVEVRCK